MNDYEDLVEMVADVGSRFATVVAALGAEQWESPGLGEWTVRELVGHTLRAFSTVDRFLDTPLDAVAAADAAEYYRIALGGMPDVHAQVAERGREAGAALGNDPAAAAVEQVSATLGRLDATSGDEIGQTAVGGMFLRDYLETRLVELVVHHSDLCHAIGLPPGDLGAAGVRATATVLASASAADRDLVLRAALGRAELPPGFTVWP